jgi:hypothetical protein
LGGGGIKGRSISIGEALRWEIVEEGQIKEEEVDVMKNRTTTMRMEKEA